MGRWSYFFVVDRFLTRDLQDDTLRGGYHPGRARLARRTAQRSPMMRHGGRPESRFVQVVAALLGAAAIPARGADRAFEVAPEHLDCRYSTASPATQSPAQDTPDPL